MRLCALLGACGLGACDPTPPATRTWTPADHAQPSNAAAAGDQMAVAPADDGLTNAERTARSVYVVACAGCHGAQGHGDGPERAPVMRLPDFASAAWQESLTDDELVSIISLGRGMMPAFGDRIPAEGLRALVGRLRAFGPPPGAPPADDAGVEVGVEAEVESDAGVAPTTAPEATTDAGVAPPAP